MRLLASCLLIFGFLLNGTLRPAAARASDDPPWKRLLTGENAKRVEELEKKIHELESDLREGEESESLRQSKTATLTILKKRQATMRKKQQTLEEIESDLTRIDNQVDLILENATVQGKPQTISADIELASDLLGGSVFGEDESVISHLEQAYGRQKTNPQKETA